MNPSLLEPGIFLHPRPKKSVLSSQPNKRRKIEHKIEEISFNDDARADYLTGFHKRKVQRARRAQEEAVKKGREERVEMRKQLREERKQELTSHVNAINAALRAAGDPDVPDSSSDSEAWGGISSDSDTASSKPSSQPNPKISTPAIDHEEEYISENEDRYTTVTIEAVDVTKDGLHRVAEEEEGNEDDDGDGEGVKKQKKHGSKDGEKNGHDGKKIWPKKPRKPKFRYESKVERKATRMKQKSRNKASADARKGGG